MHRITVFAAVIFIMLAPPVAAQQGPSALAWSAPDRELMVPVEGGAVYVRINGDIEENSATPAIFIHGGPGGTHVKFAGLLGLADERPVILYDQLGSGKSDRPDDPEHWRVERFVDELEAVRRTVGAEKLHLVGQSWGSALALEYAVRYPDRVASTVLGGTFISTIHWITDANILLRNLTLEARQAVRACESSAPPPAEQCSAAFDQVYSEHYQRPEYEDHEQYVESYGGRGFNKLVYNQMWGPSEFVSTGLLKNYDATPKLLELDGSRTLFLIGQYDSARIDTVQEFVALAEGAELAVVPGGGHAFILDRPLETEAVIRSWLRRMDSE